MAITGSACARSPWSTLSMQFLALALLPALSVSPLHGGPEGDRFGRSLLALHDVDGDGVRDFAVGAPTASEVERYGGRVLVLSGSSREVLQVWRGQSGRRHFGHDLRSAGDVDGDGVGDVLVGYEASGQATPRTEVCSGADGSLLRAFERPYPEVHALGDLDGDGTAEVLLSGKGLEVRRVADGARLWSSSSSEDSRPLHSVGDLNGDGLADGVLLGAKPQLLMTGGAASGESLSGFVSSLRFGLPETWPLPFEVGEAGPASLSALRAGPGGDLDGDGNPELVLLTTRGSQNHLWALSLAKGGSAAAVERGVRGGVVGTRAWALGSGETTDYRKGFGWGYGSWPAGDLDGDGAGDLLAGGTVGPFQVVLHAISGRTGERLWDHSMDDGGMSSGVSPILLDDADGDGVSEVLVGTCDWWWHGGVMRNGRIRCLSGASGKPLWELGVDEVSIPETEPR